VATPSAVKYFSIGKSVNERKQKAMMTTLRKAAIRHGAEQIIPVTLTAQQASN
jgi:hypothetical protein